MDDKFIIINEAQLIELVEKLIDKTGLRQKVDDAMWIDTAAAMELLAIKSKTTLFKLRSEGHLDYSEVTSKHFLYSKPSILRYILSKQKTGFYYEK